MAVNTVVLSPSFPQSYFGVVGLILFKMYLYIQHPGQFCSYRVTYLCRYPALWQKSRDRFSIWIHVRQMNKRLNAMNFANYIMYIGRR
jgi:hypothetical protein